MYDFLAAALGKDGADAMQRAAVRVPDIRESLLEKTVLAWCELNAADGFDGLIPGTNVELKTQIVNKETHWLAKTSKKTIEALGSPSSVAKKLAEIISGTFVSGNMDVKGLDFTIKLLAKAQYATTQMASAATQKINVFDGNNLSMHYSPLKKTYTVSTEGKDRVFDSFEDAKTFVKEISTSKTKPSTRSKLLRLKKTITVPGTLSKPSSCKSCGQGFFKEDIFSGCLCIQDYVNLGLVLQSGDSVLIKTSRLDEDEILSIKSVFSLDIL